MVSLTPNTLQISLSLPYDTVDTGGSLLLEQESWDPYTGHLTKMQIIGWLGRILFRRKAPGNNCPPDGPGFEKYIYAFPYPQSLNYKIGCSHGVLGARIIQNLEFSELVQCDLKLNPPMKYPAIAIKSYSFIGDCYNSKGEIVAPPSVTIRENILTLSAKVYATLRVSYLVERHTYRVAIREREEYHNKKYQSFIYAVWPGGAEFIEIDAPLGADDQEPECNNIFGGGGNFDDLPLPGGTNIEDGELEIEDEPYGPVSGSDDYIDVDYCSMEVT